MSSIPPDDLNRNLVVASPDTDGLRFLSLAGGTYTVLVSGAQTNGAYCLIDMLVPGEGGPPMHRHDFEELFIILEGELEFSFRGVQQVVKAPSSVAIPANAPHAFRNLSGAQVHMLCLCSPAGQEDYFLAVGTALPSRHAPPPMLSAEEVKAKRQLALDLAARFRTEFPDAPKQS